MAFCQGRSAWIAPLLGAQPAWMRYIAKSLAGIKGNTRISLRMAPPDQAQVAYHHCPCSPTKTASVYATPMLTPLPWEYQAEALPLNLAMT